jgi:hypothetical protein
MYLNKHVLNRQNVGAVLGKSGEGQEYEELGGCPPSSSLSDLAQSSALNLVHPFHAAAVAMSARAAG